MHAPHTHTSRENHSAKKPAVNLHAIRPCIAQEYNTCRKTQYARRSRAKRCILWEDYVHRGNSVCAERLKSLARSFPDLTPQQLRIAALVSDMLTTATIARILGVSEHAVEKVRSRIRIKLAVAKGVSLPAFLIALS